MTGFWRAAALACACAATAAAAPVPREVPLRLRPPARKIGTGGILLDCAFDGAPRQCMLDTGSGDEIVARSDRAFSRYPAGRPGANLDAVGARSRADFIRVKDLTLGAVPLGPVQVKRLAPGGRMTPPLIGLQGLGLGSFSLRLRGRARLILDAPAPKGALEPLDGTDYEKHLYVEASAAGARFAALFDTGCGLTEVDAAYAAAHPESFSFHGDYMRVPGLPDSKIYTLRALSLGGRVFRDVDVMARDFSSYRRASGRKDLRLMLGYNVITRADWYFDLARGRWKVLDAR